MKIYTVTSNFLAANKEQGENVALSGPATFKSLLTARRYIKTFCGDRWDTVPVLHRRPTPKKVVAEISKKIFHNGMAIATYRGVAKYRDTKIEIWFAIYMTNI